MGHPLIIYIPHFFWQVVLEKKHRASADMFCPNFRQVLQLLLDAKPELDATDEGGRTALHVACEAEQVQSAPTRTAHP
jgi:hypothetical protein